MAVLLYADDAALPADSAEDLQPLASPFEDFCDDNRLFIATSKTFVTVFHAASDRHVVYHDGSVSVDNVRVEISIYGEVITAAASFKYSGIVMDSTRSRIAHSASRDLRSCCTLTCGWTFSYSSVSAQITRKPLVSFGVTRAMAWICFPTPTLLSQLFNVKSVSGGDAYCKRAAHPQMLQCRSRWGCHPVRYCGGCAAQVFS